MSEEDLRQTQLDEIEVIKSIYAGDVCDDADQNKQKNTSKLKFSVRVLPQRGSTSSELNADQKSKTPTSVVISFQIPLNYPNKIPKIDVKDTKGLSSIEISELVYELNEKAKSKIGDVMIYELLSHAQEYLYQHQKASTGSFHDEMIKRQKQSQEQAQRIQDTMKEKERIALKNEILKRQEEVREEIRAKESKKNNTRTCSESGGSEQSSPVKGDVVPTNKMIHRNKKSRRELNNMRRRCRSTSEGSDSSISEHLGSTVLEFCSGRHPVFVAHRGAMLGKSQRGTSVFAGMSVTGELIAIINWKLSAKLEKKGIPEMTPGNLSIDGAKEQINAMESEFNTFQKLRHPNLVTYHGINVTLPPDEPGELQVSIAQEFIRGTTLQHYLMNNMNLDLSIVRHCALGVVSGLEYLHENNIVHRYLRDTSVYLENHGGVKLIDYGIERKISDLYLTFNGLQGVTDKFASSIGRGGKRADIYRLGVILLSILKGQYVTNNVEIPSNIPMEVQDFLKKCITPIEHSRWTASQLLDHQFLKLPIPSSSVRFKGLEKDIVSEEEDRSGILPSNISMKLHGHARFKSEFEELKFLGRGGFGDVFKVRNKLDGRIYALKRIRLNPKSKQLNKKIMREVKLLSQLNHENVVRYFNSWIETVVESDDEVTTESLSTSDGAKLESSKIANSKANIHEKSAWDVKNSLGIYDNIEELARKIPVGDSEWDISNALAHVSEDEESYESDDDDDLFGTSFRRISEEFSALEEVVFENSTDFPESSSDDQRKQNISVSEITDKKDDENENKEFLERGSRFVEFMYIQMEFCEKSTLRSAIDNGLYEEMDRGWRLFREIVEGLVHMHRQGMIHRDLKPVNIFLDSLDHVKIGDFGLATSSIIPKSKTSNEYSVLEAVDKKHLNQSLDLNDESGAGLTGHIGTAMYVAPELMTKESKINYNQKVDIYSLGIIFFEMFYRPLKTETERILVIRGLRQPEVIFPNDFDEAFLQNVTHITRWLLNHDHAKRPSSLELLQSDYLPPPHLEEAELRDFISKTLKATQTKTYKYLIASCLGQKINPVEDATYDVNLENTTVNNKQLVVIQQIKHTMGKVFQRHGAVDFSAPLMMPKSDLYEDMDTCVQLMSHSGQVVHLPHDLRVPFARFVARNGFSYFKRYALEKVYRERKVYGLHPRELMECAFDVVTPTEGCLTANAEVLSVVFEIIKEIPWLNSISYTVRLGNTKLIQGVLLHNGIEPKLRKRILKILANASNIKQSKSLIRAKMSNLGLSDAIISNIVFFYDIQEDFTKISSLFKGILKREGEAATVVKTALREIDTLLHCITSFGIKCNIVISPLMIFGSHIYSGLIFQVLCDLRKRKNRNTVDIIAAGGRYDELLDMYRSSLYVGDLDRENTTDLHVEEEALPKKPLKESSSEEVNLSGVGISISLDKIIGCAEKDEELMRTRRSLDAVICSISGGLMIKEKIDMMKDLISAGVQCSVLDGAQTLESADEFCKNVGAIFLLILKDGEYPNSILARVLERGRFNEKKLTKQETIEMIVKTKGLVWDSKDIGPTSSTSRMESGSVKPRVDLESHAVFSRETMGGPTFNLSFTFQDREKLAHFKRRYENQVMNRITEILPKFGRNQTVEVLGVEVNRAVINTLCGGLNLNDEEEFMKDVLEVVDKYPRLKKYINNICDEIYYLNFEKNISVIILYGLTDNFYRILL